ncbi:hypothetical protein VNI00_015829 [Paramarasmius palmivorus]|uniref:Glycoside hydrolase family 76 protein n=1 Tax=Paramarasmius palmivorus TaxID=297713 RepID=A0AAW0BIJ0_9AGAR
MPADDYALVRWGLLFLLNEFVKAQEISSTWKKPSISIPPLQQRAIAEAALDEAINNLGPNGQFGDDYIIAGNLYSQMAEFDLATGGTKYRDVLKGYFNFAQAGRAKFADSQVCRPSQIQNGLAYGYAAARAYVAYRDETFLNFAVDSWSFGNLWTITQSDAQRGHIAVIAVKTFDLGKECRGATVAGGTFANQTPDDPLVFTDTTACVFTSFHLSQQPSRDLHVSALLAEATLNQTYSDAALLSCSFVKNQLYSSGNFAGAIFVGQNDSCVVNQDQRPSHAGLFIEGLGVLSAVVQDQSLDSLLQEVIPLSIVDPAWQGTDGIIAQGGDKTGDLYMVRGMRAVLARNRVSTNLAAYMKAYMAVQYNAVLDIGNNNIYGQSWVPGSSSTFDPVGQTNAVAVFVDALSINLTSVTNPPNPQAAPTPTHGKSSVSIGAVVGSVVGGTVLAVVVISAYVLRRRRRTQEKDRKLAPYTLSRDRTAHVVNEKHTVANDASVTPVVPTSHSRTAHHDNAAASTNVFAFNIAEQSEPLAPPSADPNVVQQDEPDISEPRPNHLAQFDEQVSTADLFLVIRSKGLHLLRPEKSWRPVVCITVQANPRSSTSELSYETTLGLDGQNPNQKEIFVIGSNAARDTKISIQVVYQPPGKKKAKRMKRSLVACCTCSLGDVLEKQAMQKEKSEFTSFLHPHPIITPTFLYDPSEVRLLTSMLPAEYAQLRLQAQCTSKRSKKKNDCDSQPAILYVRLREPSSVMTEQVMSDEEYASSHHPESWPDSHTEVTMSPPLSPIDEAPVIDQLELEPSTSATGVNVHPGDLNQTPRPRRRKRIRGFIVNSDDEACSVSCSSSEDEEGVDDEKEDSGWALSPTDATERDDCEHRGPWLRVGWISAMLDPVIPMHTKHLERPYPSREDTLVEGREPFKDEGWDDWCWRKVERFLCAFTVYGELCSAAKCLDSLLQYSKAEHDQAFKSIESVNSFVSATVIEGGEFSRLEEEAKMRVERVYQRLQNEWSYVGALLVALAAVDTAVFAISPDALFAVSTVARPMVATSSVCSGCGIACVVWFLWWYGWGSGVGFGGHDGAGSGLGGVDGFMSRALDINKTYVSFALAARMPAFCMVCSAVSLMAFLAVVAYDAAPVIVWIVCCGVAVGMSGQFIVWGLVKLVLGIRAAVKWVARGVQRLGGGGDTKQGDAIIVAEEKGVTVVVTAPSPIADTGRDHKSSRYS